MTRRNRNESITRRGSALLITIVALAIFHCTALVAPAMWWETPIYDQVPAFWWTLSEETSPTDLQALLRDPDANVSRFLAACESCEYDVDLELLRTFLDGDDDPHLIPMWQAFGALGHALSSSESEVLERLAKAHGLSRAGLGALSESLTRFAQEEAAIGSDLGPDRLLLWEILEDGADAAGRLAVHQLLEAEDFAALEQLTGIALTEIEAVLRGAERSATVEAAIAQLPRLRESVSDQDWEAIRDLLRVEIAPGLRTHGRYTGAEKSGGTLVWENLTYETDASLCRDSLEVTVKATLVLQPPIDAERDVYLVDRCYINDSITGTIGTYEDYDNDQIRPEDESIYIPGADVPYRVPCIEISELPACLPDGSDVEYEGYANGKVGSFSWFWRTDRKKLEKQSIDCVHCFSVGGQVTGLPDGSTSVPYVRLGLAVYDATDQRLDGGDVSKDFFGNVASFQFEQAPHVPTGGRFVIFVDELNGVTCQFEGERADNLEADHFDFVATCECTEKGERGTDACGTGEPELFPVTVAASFDDVPSLGGFDTAQ